MFKVLDFTYDGKSSTDIGLKLVKFDGSGIATDSVAVPLEIEDTKIKRIDKPFFFGVEATPKLSFKIQLAYLPDNGKSSTENYLTPQTFGAITRWLTRREYKEFKIIDCDYTNVIYKCMFQNPKKIEIGNYPIGIELDVICDRPYGYYSQTISKTVNGTTTFNYQNVGFLDVPIYPILEITMGATGGTALIQNNTDSNKQTTFTGLSANEVVNVDMQKQIIVSSTGLNRNSNFNFNWFRVMPQYYNSITLTGIFTVKFKTEFPMPV